MKYAIFEDLIEKGKTTTIIFCPFCDIGLFNDSQFFKKDGYYWCIACNKIFYEKSGVWYYRRIRDEKLCKKENTIPKIDYCPNCNGQGFTPIYYLDVFQNMKRCEYCMGTGRELK